jgi:hypothetical protein
LLNEADHWTEVGLKRDQNLIATLVLRDVLQRDARQFESLERAAIILNRRGFPKSA